MEAFSLQIPLTTRTWLSGRTTLVPPLGLGRHPVSGLYRTLYLPLSVVFATCVSTVRQGCLFCPAVCQHACWACPSASLLFFWTKVIGTPFPVSTM